MENIVEKQNHLLQTSIDHLHKESINWLSEIEFWKEEMEFFRHQLERNIDRIDTDQEKKKLEQLQNKIIYFDGELTDEFHHNIKEHESFLARLISDERQDEQTYRDQHNKYREELNAFREDFRDFKRDLFHFLEEI